MNSKIKRRGRRLSGGEIKNRSRGDHLVVGAFGDNALVGRRRARKKEVFVVLELLERLLQRRRSRVVLGALLAFGAADHERGKDLRVVGEHFVLGAPFEDLKSVLQTSRRRHGAEVKAGHGAFQSS